MTNVDRTDELTVTAARLSGGYQYINLGNPLGDLREAPCGTSSCYVLNYEESGDPLKTAEVLIDKQTFYLVRRTIVTKWSQGEVLTDVSTLKDLLPR